MPKRATPLRRVNGKLVSARSKTGNPMCSQAASAWNLLRHGKTSPMPRDQIFKVLARCRSGGRPGSESAALARSRDGRSNPNPPREVPAPGNRTKPMPAAPSTPGRRVEFFTEAEKNLPKDARQPVLKPDAGYEEFAAKARVASKELAEILDEGKGIGPKLGYQTKKPNLDDPAEVEAFRRPGGYVMLAPVKGRARSVEKVDSEFGGDWSRLLDGARASVAVDSVGEVRKVITMMRRAGLKPARAPKDRLNNPLSSGYRDVLINVTTPSGMIGEVQVHLKPMLVAKASGHKHYETMREVDAAAAKRGGTMTKEERRKWMEAFYRSRKLYGEAWKQAAG